VVFGPTAAVSAAQAQIKTARGGRDPGRPAALDGLADCHVCRTRQAMVRGTR